MNYNCLNTIILLTNSKEIRNKNFLFNYSFYYDSYCFY